MARPKAIKAQGGKPLVGAKTLSKVRPQNGMAVDRVIVAAASVKKAAKIKPTKSDLAVFTELEELAAYIQAAKLEIAQIRPDDMKDEHLLTAIDELDAVVDAAADATNTIMDACEIVESVMGDVAKETSDKLMDATTRIYEACTFQDITGQRIHKVVKTMRHIEDRIDALIMAFSVKTGAQKTTPKVPKQTGARRTGESQVISDEDLLEGPQLGGKAKSQAEIDELFASFD